MAVAGGAALLTALMAWPVVMAPTEQIFGVEIVGRHHDPFTVMRQMAGAGSSGPYIQPLTDWSGWLLARVLHPVAAYNVLILATFPLTAAATYLLARYLRLSRLASMAAALLFAFAPLHLAHAAYHPHIAQTQWIPLYLLALFATIDRPSPTRATCLAAACAALVLSNFYAGLIGAVLTPVALGAYWWASPRAPRARNLWITTGVLAALAAGGIATVLVAHPQLLTDPSPYAFRISGIFLYSARWWAYFVPSVTHAAWGSAAAGVFERAGVTTELVEQQVFVSHAVIALAAIALLQSVYVASGFRLRDSYGGPPKPLAEAASRTTETPTYAGFHIRPGRLAIALWAIALAAALVSIGPLRGGCGPDSWAPACHLYTVLPMFRSYARFAFVTHLALALAAGLGLAALARTGRAGRLAAVVLCVIASFEYWPQPAMARDVLPTAAHRWLARQSPALGAEARSAKPALGAEARSAEPALGAEARSAEAADQHALDCTTSPSDSHVPWLMQRRLTFARGTGLTCRDPGLGARLAALGYTHAIVTLPDAAGIVPLVEREGAGLTRVAEFPGSRVYEVAVSVPPIVVVADRGFFEYEHDGDRVWRWMGAEGTWVVRNTTTDVQRVSLALAVESVHEPRDLELALDALPSGALHVPIIVPTSRVFGPWLLTPGDHTLVFRASGLPFRPSEHGFGRDERPLTVAFRNVEWHDASETSDNRPR